ncbi:nuclear transport factor 2 family protein [Sphingomonas sp. CL5.1]|uniref:nuclear transport factor 2 family protein n=1 Tax=Sphingomonas sp. CL5.1 TaxID=2653203 RepID=UPI0020C60C5B|nr:nuclear transport factor 2 family protein [Sphingomonas sp. CL5.1]
MSRLEDEAALRRTAELYAAGADRRDKAIWARILTAGCVIEGPGFRTEGREANLGSIDLLARLFLKTRHRVHNQLVTIDGDRADGETYSTADHLSERDGGRALLCWAIRYQDKWRREDGEWRFSHRTLIVDWEETRMLPALTAASAIA